MVEDSGRDGMCGGIGNRDIFLAGSGNDTITTLSQMG